MPAVAPTESTDDVDQLGDLTPAQRARVDAVILHNRNSEWARARRTYQAKPARVGKQPAEVEPPALAHVDIARRAIAFCRAGYSDAEAESYALNPNFTTPKRGDQP